MAVFYPLTGSLGSILGGGVIGGCIVALVAFFLAYITWILVPPVVMMENLSIRESLRRSRALVKRSFATSAGAVLIMFLIPAVAAISISYVLNISAKAFDPKPPSSAEGTQQPADPTASVAPTPEVEKMEQDFNFSFGRRSAALRSGDKLDMRTRVKNTALESLMQILWLPMQILVFSFFGIIVALLYLKTRLAGGESTHDLVERFEDDGRPRKRWQERVRQRLIQSGRISSNPSR